MFTPKELAWLLETDEREVARWVEEGCPHVRLRERLVLLDRDEVARWLLRTRYGELPALLAGRWLARTLDDVGAMYRLLAALLASGRVDVEQAQEISKSIEAIAGSIRERRRRGA